MPGDRATSSIGTLVEMIDRAAARYGERPALGLRLDDGTSWHWSYRELALRSRAVAWRLRALGLAPGDRLLTWSPSTPALVAAYVGAMRARLVYVPLDLRMSPAAIEGIVASAEPRLLVLGSGRDAPDPALVRLEHLPTIVVEELAAPPGEGASGIDFPPDWEAQLAGWEPPEPEEIYQLVFTSGTTGTPKGVMLAHAGAVATIEGIHRVIPPLEHRIASVLPLSHLYEQLVGTYYPLDVGAHILHIRSRSPRVIAEAIRDHRTTTMATVPAALDLLMDGLLAELRRSGSERTFTWLRRIGRRLPFGWRRALFRPVHRRFLGTDFRIFVSIGAYLPPSLQLAWEELGIVVLQGYGSTETAFGAANRLDDRGLGTVGRSVPPFEIAIAPDGEVLFRGPSLFRGYWRNPEATARVFDAEGWYHTGDAGRFDAAGRLVLTGRTRDMIVLPNGFNVFPEDLENALRDAGIRDSIVLETRPGRIEAVVLAPDRPHYPTGEIPSAAPAGLVEAPEALRATIDAAVREANGHLGAHQRIVGWRLWPAADFPRTHTLKVKRDQIRAWVAVDEAGRDEATGSDEATASGPGSGSDAEGAATGS